MQKAELQALIRAAFDEVPYPGDYVIGVPPRPTIYDVKDDGEEVEEFLRGRDWRSFRADELWYGSLFFITTTAFHYYFPAYLLASLEDLEVVSDDVFALITPSNNPEFSLRYAAFTPAQKRCVLEFVKYVIEEMAGFPYPIDNHVEVTDVAKRNLLRFWENF